MDGPRTCVAFCVAGLLVAPALIPAQAPVFPAPRVQEQAAIQARRLPGFPLLFVENRGRYADRVRYHVEHEGGAILVTDTGIIFRDHGSEDLVLEFPGRHPDSRVEGESRAPTLIHYLIGKEDAWRTDVPTYRRLRYAGLWPGIDLVLKGERGAVKYEFVVAPGADPGKVRMRYAGARLALDAAGGLEVHDGEALRRSDPTPVAFQVVGGVERPVRASFVQEAESTDTVEFSVGAYDRSRPLVIDPAFLAHSGYLPPGMGPYAIAVDAAGAAIVAGMYQRTPTDMDACVVRVRPDGTGFDFVTHVGGVGNDIAMGVAADASGIYVAGHTLSDEQSFPVKVGPDLTYNGGGLDCFVCKLAPDGKTVLYCGYVGGSGNDGIREGAVAVDSAGAVWIAGQTTSGDYPVRGGPQLTMPGPEPACVTKVAPDGRSLMLSGYLGGSSRHTQYCAGVAVDGNGDGYVVGRTGSDERSFPAKVGPLTKWQGGIDAFIAKIDGRTGALVYCGYVGGALDDEVWSVAVDAQGAAYVSGQTYSNETTFPVIGGPVLKATFSSIGTDGFLAKVNPNGTGFVYSGFLGGMVAQGVAVDSRQRCYLGGNMQPITPAFPVGGALSPVPCGTLDGFVMRLSADGRTFEYSGYLGGTSTDNITALALGPRDTVHVAGITLSSGTFPVQIGPSLVFNGQVITYPIIYGTFVAKIAEASMTPSGTGRLGTTVTFSLLANDDPGLSYQAGTSLGNGPTPLGSRTLGLSPDPFLWVSTTGSWPTIFEGYAGQIGANGTATAKIHIPGLVVLVGLRLHTAFVTFDPLYPLGIKSISDTAAFTIMK